MEARHHWFRGLDAEHRSWITLVARAGIDGFVNWFADPEPLPPTHVRRVRLRPAGAGPPDLAPPDRRAGAHHHRRGGDPDRRGDAAGRPADPARRDRRLQPRGGLRRGRDLRPGGRAARAPGTRGWRRWWSTPCCAARPTTPCCPGPRRWAGRRRRAVVVVVGAGPGPGAERWRWSRSGTPRPSPASTCSARSRATG